VPLNLSIFALQLAVRYLAECKPMAAPIILLEDDPAIAHTVGYALEREGYTVDHAALVADARRKLLEPTSRYVAAILDVGLPDGSGLDLCRSLRQYPGAIAALPIVLLTARSEEIDRVLGLELGADDYVTKPFSPRELCARVRALLRRTERSALEPTVRAESKASSAPALLYDAERQSVRFGAHLLPLTRRELGLMTLLMKHPGRIWSREALLDAVWGQSAESNDRTVDTHVKTLRAKLREVGCDPDLIGTHRGLGYAIDPARL
jgi:two-component system catabolic regulation response regulator CreB